MSEASRFIFKLFAYDPIRLKVRLYSHITMYCLGNDVIINLIGL